MAFMGRGDMPSIDFGNNINGIQDNNNIGDRSQEYFFEPCCFSLYGGRREMVSMLFFDVA